MIHVGSGFKADLIVAKSDDFNESRFARHRILTLESGARVRFASPEDVIIRKLQYYKEGGSDKHLRDIRGVLAGAEVDRAYIQHWVRRFGLDDQWREAQR